MIDKKNMMIRMRSPVDRSSGDFGETRWLSLIILRSSSPYSANASANALFFDISSNKNINARAYKRLCGTVSGFYGCSRGLCQSFCCRF